MFNWIQRLGEELDRCLSGKTRYQFVIWRRIGIKDAFQIPIILMIFRLKGSI